MTQPDQPQQDSPDQSRSDADLGGDLGPAGEANSPTATPPGEAHSSGDLGALGRDAGDGSAAETP